MTNQPRTAREARYRLYHEGFGEVHYDPRFCAWEMSSRNRYGQCSRKPGHGPDGLYCRQHAAQLEKQDAEQRSAG